MSPVAPPSCNMQANGSVIPWNGLEKGQYTPSFSLQIPVYFDVGINVTYLKCALPGLEKLELVGQGVGSGIDDFETKLKR